MDKIADASDHNLLVRPYPINLHMTDEYGFMQIEQTINFNSSFVSSILFGGRSAQISAFTDIILQHEATGISYLNLLVFHRP